MQIRRFVRFANFHVSFPVTSHLSSFSSTCLPPIPVSPPVPNYLLTSYSTYLRPSISNRPLPIFLHLPLPCSPPLLPSCMFSSSPILYYSSPPSPLLSTPFLSLPLPLPLPCPLCFPPPPMHLSSHCAFIFHSPLIQPSTPLLNPNYSFHTPSHVPSSQIPSLNLLFRCSLTHSPSPLILLHTSPTSPPIPSLSSILPSLSSPAPLPDCHLSSTTSSSFSAFFLTASFAKRLMTNE